jgi:hypothetical protein
MSITMLMILIQANILKNLYFKKLFMDSVIKFFQIEISFKNTHNYNKSNLLLITNLQLIKEYVQPTKKLILENR